MNRPAIALILLAFATPSLAQSADADSALAERARHGSSIGTSVTGAMLWSGGGLLLAAALTDIDNTRGAVAGTGLGLFVLGGLVGPATGWQAAGETSHALRSIALHTVVLGAPVLAVMASIDRSERNTWETAGAIAAVGLLSTVVNGVLCYHELHSFERIMRADAASRTTVSVVPARLGSGAVGLAVKVPLH